MIGRFSTYYHLFIYGGDKEMNKKITILILLMAFVGCANAAIPPDPIDLTSDTSTSGHVIWSWSAGTGNITDSYNVSVDSIWHNGTTSTTYDDDVGSGSTSYITVWAFNNSNSGNLSAGNVTGSQRAVFTFSSVTSIINAVIPVLNSIIDLILAIVPLMILMVLIAALYILIDDTLKRVHK